MNPEGLAVLGVLLALLFRKQTPGSHVTKPPAGDGGNGDGNGNGNGHGDGTGKGDDDHSGDDHSGIGELTPDIVAWAHSTQRDAAGYITKAPLGLAIVGDPKPTNLDDPNWDYWYPRINSDFKSLSNIYDGGRSPLVLPGGIRIRIA